MLVSFGMTWENLSRVMLEIIRFAAFLCSIHISCCYLLCFVVNLLHMLTLRFAWKSVVLSMAAQRGVTGIIFCSLLSVFGKEVKTLRVGDKIDLSLHTKEQLKHLLICVRYFCALQQNSTACCLKQSECPDTFFIRAHRTITSPKCTFLIRS